jgi:hypothetical protein
MGGGTVRELPCRATKRQEAEKAERDEAVGWRDGEEEEEEEGEEEGAKEGERAKGGRESSTQ